MLTLTLTFDFPGRRPDSASLLQRTFRSRRMVKIRDVFEMVSDEFSLLVHFIFLLHFQDAAMVINLRLAYFQLQLATPVHRWGSM